MFGASCVERSPGELAEESGLPLWESTGVSPSFAALTGSGRQHVTGVVHSARLLGLKETVFPVLVLGKERG